MIAITELIVTHFTGAGSTCRSGWRRDNATDRTTVGGVIATLVSRRRRLQPVLRAGGRTGRVDRSGFAGRSRHRRRVLNRHQPGRPTLHHRKGCCGARGHGAGLTRVD